MSKANNIFGSATTPKESIVVSNKLKPIGPPFELVYFFRQMFDDGQSLVERNRFLMLYVDKIISSKEIPTLFKLMNDNAVMDFHPSLMKSLLLITSSIKDQKTITELWTKIEVQMKSRL